MPKATKNLGSNSMALSPAPEEKLPTFETGDFKIISSDNHEYMVETYHLQTWSETFRDMVSACNGEKSIELPERGLVIWQFLHLTKYGSIRLCGENWDVVFCDFVLFLCKYQCEIAIQLLIANVSSFKVGEALQPLLLFLIGVISERHELCARALEMKMQRWTDCPPASRPRHVGSLTMNILHPKAFSRGLFCRMPQDVLWALTQLPLWSEKPDEQGNMGSRFLEPTNHVV